MATPPRKQKKEPPPPVGEGWEALRGRWRPEYQKENKRHENAKHQRQEAIAMRKRRLEEENESPMKNFNPLAYGNRRGTRRVAPPAIHRKGTRSRLNNNERDEINARYKPWSSNDPVPVSPLGRPATNLTEPPAIKRPRHMKPPNQNGGKRTKRRRTRKSGR